MAKRFHERTVETSRKPRYCFWCGELIQVGTRYELWRENLLKKTLTVNVHCSCKLAWDMLRPACDVFPEYSPRRGTHQRGSTLPNESFFDTAVPHPGPQFHPY